MTDLIKESILAELKEIRNQCEKIDCEFRCSAEEYCYGCERYKRICELVSRLERDYEDLEDKKNGEIDKEIYRRRGVF